jgi:hypothetical protein
MRLCTVLSLAAALASAHAAPGHIPYEMYVREAGRLVGRHVLTEHDGSLAPGLARTPIFADSVVITDWYMDSHACARASRLPLRRQAHPPRIARCCRAVWTICSSPPA